MNAYASQHATRHPRLELLSRRGEHKVVQELTEAERRQVARESCGADYLPLAPPIYQPTWRMVAFSAVLSLPCWVFLGWVIWRGVTLLDRVAS